MATRYWISAAGSDSDPGTYNLPWQSIDKMMQENSSFVNGDIIMFDGNYSYTYTGQIKFEHKHLTIASYNGMAFLSGQVTWPTHFIEVGNASGDFNLINLEIACGGNLTGAGACVNFTGTSTTGNVYGCYVHDASNGIYARKGATVYVNGSRVEDMGVDGISSNETESHMWGINSYIRRCGLVAAAEGNALGDGATTHNSSTINLLNTVIDHCNKGVTNVSTTGVSLIANNVFMMRDTELYTSYQRHAIDVSQGAEVDIFGNLIILCGSQNMAGIKCSHSGLARWYNNTVISTNSNLSTSLYNFNNNNPDLLVNIDSRNNIGYSTGSQNIMFQGVSALSSISVSNCAFYPGTTDREWIVSFGYDIFKTLFTVTNTTTGEDPGILIPAHLLTGSVTGSAESIRSSVKILPYGAAYRRGLNLYGVPYLETDMFGTERPILGPWDIGHLYYPNHSRLHLLTYGITPYARYGPTPV